MLYIITTLKNKRLCFIYYIDFSPSVNRENCHDILKRFKNFSIYLHHGMELECKSKLNFTVAVAYNKTAVVGPIVRT